MKNPAAMEQLKAQKISVDVARRRYQTEAPKFIELATSYTRPKKLADAQNNEYPNAPCKPEIAMPLSAFLAETPRLAALSKRNPGEVKRIDAAAEIVVPRIRPIKPQHV